MIQNYENISNSISKFTPIPISTYLPKLKESDYRRGYITRYFVQHAFNRPGIISEISKQQFSQFQSNNFYIVVFLDWRITGTDTEILNSNRKSMLIASKQMPMILNYLRNPYQFSKNFTK